MADSSTMTQAAPDQADNSMESHAATENGASSANADNVADGQEALSSPAEIDARRARQLLERSVALSERGDAPGALLACRQAVALAPTWPAAYSLLARLLERGGNANDAISALEKVVGLAPESAAERDSLNRLRNLSQKRAASPVFHFNDSELFDDAPPDDATPDGATSNADAAIATAAPGAPETAIDAATTPPTAGVPASTARMTEAATTVGIAPSATSATLREVHAASTDALAASAPKEAVAATVVGTTGAQIAPRNVEPEKANVIAPPVVSAAPAIPMATAPSNLQARGGLNHTSPAPLSAAIHSPAVSTVAPVDFGDAPVAPRGRTVPWQVLNGQRSFYVRSVPLAATAVLGLLFMLWARGSALSRRDASRVQTVDSTTVTESLDQSAASTNNSSTQAPDASTATGANGSTSANGASSAPNSGGASTPGGNAPFTASSPANTANANPNGVAASASGQGASGATTGAPRTTASAPPNRGTTVSVAPGPASSAPAPRPNPFEGLTPPRNLPQQAPPVVSVVPNAQIATPDNGGASSGGGPLNPAAAGRRGAQRVIPGALQPALPRADNRASMAEEAARDAANRGQAGRAIRQSTASINAGGADVAFRLQQRALLHVDQGDNARAIDDFRGAIAAYNDLISRGVRVAEARKGLAACQSGLRLAQASLGR